MLFLEDENFGKQKEERILGTFQCQNSNVLYRPLPSHKRPMSFLKGYLWVANK